MIEAVWPLRVGLSLSDHVARKIKRVPGYCNICGSLTIFDTSHENLREHAVCLHCGSCNRHRQIAAVLLSYALFKGTTPPRLASIRNLPSGTVIWNAETTRALHTSLQAWLGNTYISTEYVSPDLESGAVVNEITHVDIQRTHFAENSLDFILTSDVMEHVPHPEKALRETYRILKPNGCHIFTAPFYHHRFTVERRACLTDDGTINHRCKPWYHDDPMRSEGALVYNVFAPEFLCQIEAVGFEAKLLRLHSPFHGIYGNNGIVLVARKAAVPDYARDWIFT